jgi:hypothetical protein
VVGWCAAASIAGNLALVPYSGAIGVALMSSATLIAWNIVLFALAYRRTGVGVSGLGAMDIR